MARGGARAGAGRPKGSKTKLSRQPAERLVEPLEVTPLEVMVKTMRARWAESEMASDLAAAKVAAGEACSIAEKCAPYMHPRLSSVEASVTHDVSKLSDADLDAEISKYLAEGALQGIAAGAGGKAN